MAEAHKTEFLGRDAMFPLILKMGIPAAVGMLVNALYNVVDTIFVGLGEAILRMRRLMDAARAQGMTEWQILTQVELPLALPLLVGGLRSATLQVVATATIAAYVAQGGLGRYLIEGLRTQDYLRALIGAVLIAALALILDGLLAALQRLVVPRGVSRGASRTKSSTGTTAQRPSRSLRATRAPVTEG